MKRLLFTLFLLIPIWVCAQSASVSGTVKDITNGEVLSFATIFVPGTSVGATSNVYGFYSLSIPDSLFQSDSISIACSFLGYETGRVSVGKGQQLQKDIALHLSTATIGEVEIVAEKNRLEQELHSTEMSTVRVQMKEIEKLPVLGGEVDILKSAQLLPGISGGIEGSTGFFVRGGDADQNLVLIDEATVYNTGHLFGFLSVFNPDAIAGMTVTKGGFPAEQGGRLSGVLDIRQRDGNQTGFHGKGGIGLLSSRLTLEGPIVKEKGAFLISGRRTYLDQVFGLLGATVPYYFYDVNVKANYQLTSSDRVYYSSYYGNDVLAFSEDDFEEEAEEDSIDFGINFGYRLGNYTHTLRWNHIYSDKLFSNVSLIATSFTYDINGQFANNNIYIGSKVNDYGVKGNFEYYPENGRKITYGGQWITHYFRPNVISTSGLISDFWEGSEGDQLLANEFAGFISDQRQFKNDKIRINSGIRISGVGVKGRVYAGVEPRLAARYKLKQWDVLKLSYSRMRQYMHRVSSSTVALPTDLWYPVTAQVRPQTADQVAAGYQHLFNKQQISVSIESYFKRMDGLTEYREGANLILNDNFEQELLQGTGRSFGGEFLVRKEKGKLTGWIAYTLARTTRYFDELNQGVRFPATYDRTHDFALVLSYELTDRITFSTVWVYASGSRFTAQIGQHLFPDPSMTSVELVPIYTSRNAVQMSPSHRLDVNFTFEGKERKRWKNEWVIGGYNIYGRANPYRVEIVPSEESLGYHYQQPGLFGFVFSLAYNFEF